MLWWEIILNSDLKLQEILIIWQNLEKKMVLPLQYLKDLVTGKNLGHQLAPEITLKQAKLIKQRLC